MFELHEAEQSVREAVALAERTASTSVESVLLAVACGRLESNTFTADTTIAGRAVDGVDI